MLRHLLQPDSEIFNPYAPQTLVNESLDVEMARRLARSDSENIRLRREIETQKRCIEHWKDLALRDNDVQAFSYITNKHYHIDREGFARFAADMNDAVAKLQEKIAALEDEKKELKHKVEIQTANINIYRTREQRLILQLEQIKANGETIISAPQDGTD